MYFESNIIFQRFLNDFYDQITDKAGEGFEYRDEDGTSIFVIQFDRYWNWCAIYVFGCKYTHFLEHVSTCWYIDVMLTHYIRNPYLHPERYPYFKENERLADKIKNMKENVVKRIKLLVEKCDQKIGLDRTIKELEKPDKVGNSLAFVVCRDFTDDLFHWLKELDIQPNTIAMGNLMTPFFRERQVVEYLLEKGVSPFIQYEEDSRQDQATAWRCQRDDFHHNFETMGDDALSDESQEILKNLMEEQSLCECTDSRCSKPKVDHAVCFSPFDTDSIPLDSDQYFKAGFTKNKNIVPFNCSDARIYGNMYEFFYHDTSMVFKTKWNGQDAVMKCLKYIPKYHPSVNEACNHLAKILAEFSAARESNENLDNVLPPLAYFRQQYLNYQANDEELTRKFEHPENPRHTEKNHFKQASKVLNIDVLVYPRFKGNLRELKEMRKDCFSAAELRKIF